MAIRRSRRRCSPRRGPIGATRSRQGARRIARQLHRDGAEHQDNLANQKLALRQLSQIGYRADMAANEMEPIESIERQSEAVVLMDVQMPEMEGPQAMQSLARGS